MTYCVGLLLNEGMVMLSDTRTNAGLDNISTYRKMFYFEDPGERVIVVDEAEGGAAEFDIKESTSQLAEVEANLDFGNISLKKT